MSKTTKTIIIPCYNEANLISACLESVRMQTSKDWECIVVDDGSTDATPSLIEKFCEQDSRIQLVKQAHAGPANARNLAASKAQGEVLVFVDADMVLHKDYLDELSTPILIDNVLGTFTRSEIVANWENPWARCWNYEYTSDRSNRRLPKKHPNTSNVFRAIKKSAFDSVGGFDDTGYTDDWTLSQKLKQKAIAADKAIVYHHNPASASEVSLQASWVGKRDYKFGLLGAIWALVRANPFFSLAVGLVKAVYFREPHYIVFKHVYNAGLTIGILMSIKNLPKSR